jgi:hypothetical protein
MSWLGKGTLKVNQNQMLLDELHQNSCDEHEQIARLTLQSLLKTCGEMRMLIFIR